MAVPRILSGQSDSDLNEMGYKQSMTLAWMLKKEKLDYIYTSDLKRAVQTTKEIAKHHPNTPIIMDKGLREQVAINS